MARLKLSYGIFDGDGGCARACLWCRSVSLATMWMCSRSLLGHGCLSRRVQCRRAVPGFSLMCVLHCCLFFGGVCVCFVFALLSIGGNHFFQAYADQSGAVARNYTLWHRTMKDRHLEFVPNLACGSGGVSDVSPTPCCPLLPLAAPCYAQR